MATKRNWFIVTVSFIFLLVVPTASSETTSQDAGESWVSSDIEEVLNIYGPTSSGPPPNTVNNLPYEEMGVYLSLIHI